MFYVLIHFSQIGLSFDKNVSIVNCSINSKSFKAIYFFSLKFKSWRLLKNQVSFFQFPLLFSNCLVLFRIRGIYRRRRLTQCQWWPSSARSGLWVPLRTSGSPPNSSIVSLPPACRLKVSHRIGTVYTRCFWIMRVLELNTMKEDSEISASRACWYSSKL